MVEILQPGIFTSIQDFGRIGFQKFGVPYSGVMDRYAAVVANTLVGNPENSPVLEITMMGLKLEFHCPAVIAVSGAASFPNINDKSVPLNRTISVHKGDVLSFGRLNDGFRSYLAVKGGFKGEKVMGSYSMYGGITASNRLNKGDTISIDETPDALKPKNASFKVNRDYILKDNIEVFKGPEYDKLNKTQQSKLLEEGFTISKDSNRMGYRLEQTVANDLAPILTAPVLPGTVQLTPSGKPIILMRDCQTTGGYPRIFQLKETAINVLAQKYMGQSIKFKLVD
ncbi:5-oxoprolinase subunit C family protein [Hyunsoonleella rubra]|uniref:Biotin-dependent carboxyltransferase family protein n=1 Tax=Hyunsoonleella rubra TaxID=1737062 RepID=A0ABW5TG22_9FLAO